MLVDNGTWMPQYHTSIIWRNAKYRDSTWCLLVSAYIIMYTCFFEDWTWGMHFLYIHQLCHFWGNYLFRCELAALVITGSLLTLPWFHPMSSPVCSDPSSCFWDLYTVTVTHTKPFLGKKYYLLTPVRFRLYIETQWYKEDRFPPKMVLLTYGIYLNAPWFQKHGQ